MTSSRIPFEPPGRAAPHHGTSKSPYGRPWRGVSPAPLQAPSLLPASVWGGVAPGPARSSFGSPGPASPGGGPPRPGSGSGLFTGSLLEQAQKLAQWAFAPYQAQYTHLRGQISAQDAEQLAKLQAYIDWVAQSLSGVAPQVQQAYENAAHDQSAFAKGFSDAVSGAAQQSADQNNTVLASLNAPAGQQEGPGQAVAAGDVTYGLGGYIPATSLAGQGARAYADAAQLPGIVKQRGLGIIGDLTARQQQELADLDSQYQQAVAGQRTTKLGILQSLQQRQQANRAAAAKAAQPQLHYYTDGAGVVHVINEKTGASSALPGSPRATAASRPLVVGSSATGWTIYDSITGAILGKKPPGAAKPIIKTDPRTGVTSAIDSATGQVIWRQKTGAPEPAKAPSPFSGPNGSKWVMVPAKGGGWTVENVVPGSVPTPKPIVKTDPASGMTTAVDSATGKVLWRTKTGTPKAATGTQPKVFSNGAAWVPQKDGSLKYIPPPKKDPAQAGLVDPDTKQPLSKTQIADDTATVRLTIAGARKRGLKLEDVVDKLKQEGIPDAIWGPIVMNAYNIPRTVKDVKFLSLPRLRSLAVMLGWRPDPAHPLDRAGFVQWITANLPKGSAAAETAAVKRAPGGQYYPVTTPFTAGSEFATVDAEGAPDASGTRHHAAKDWFAPAGSAVSSPIPGTVVEVKQSSGTSGQIFGGVVKVQGANGRVWVFRHVDPGQFNVGDKVKAGQEIATVSPWQDGSTHVHIELWKTLSGGYHYENMIDPASIYGAAYNPKAARTPPVTAQSVTRFLRSQSSPLAGLGGFIVQQAAKYGIDPRLIVAIAGAETSFGTYGPSQKIHNPFGWGPGISFPSWRAAIATAARHLRYDYIDKGYTTVAQISGKWAPIKASNDPTGLNENWTANVTQILTDLGGDPNSLLLGGL